MVIFSDEDRIKKAAGDGYGKQKVSKKRFEEIVKEEKGVISRAELKKMYFVKK